MYDLPQSLLVANPINRYLINSPMLPQLQRDADGGVTLIIQNASPGKDKEANWLPAPKGPFWMAMRLYWPKNEALDGKMRTELDSIFGVPLTTDIENIFLKKPGPFLRHSLSHGLLHDGDPYGPDAIYCLLAYLSYLHAAGLSLPRTNQDSF